MRKTRFPDKSDVALLIGLIGLCCLAFFLPGSKETQGITVKSEREIIRLIGEGCVEVVYFKSSTQKYVNDKLVEDKFVGINFSHAERVGCPK